MKTAILKLWVRALRSGKYKQARRRLRICHGYCCLGVLCDLYIKKTGKGRWEHRDGGYFFNYSQSTIQNPGDSETSTLPAPVMRWAGLKDDQVQLAPRKYETSSDPLHATTLNDGEHGIKRHNFKQIADALLAAAKARTLR